MRNVLVDYARKALADKRGRGERPLRFDEEAYSVNVEKGWEILALEDGLSDLAALDPELARLVELRFFGGLTVEETAEIMGTSPATVKRGFRTAKIWLRRAIERR
jgi:RNA polymerase sigma factor (TIGR02999 family)